MTRVRRHWRIELKQRFHQTGTRFIPFQSACVARRRGLEIESLLEGARARDSRRVGSQALLNQESPDVISLSLGTLPTTTEVEVTIEYIACKDDEILSSCECHGGRGDVVIFLTTTDDDTGPVPRPRHRHHDRHHRDTDTDTSTPTTDTTDTMTLTGTPSA